MELVGTATTTGGTFTCSSDFDLNLNFRDVTANQIATASGSTTCSTAGVTVAITVSGVVAAGGRFDGTITGLLPDRTGDSAALTGTLSHGVLLASFAGLEPIRGVPYSGTVATRQTTCDGLARSTCTGSCAWYNCAHRGAGGCFPTGTPNAAACPPADQATCAAIHTASTCTFGCSWYACANHGAGGCFLTGTPNATACP